ncbi:uncharacterized protein LOC129731339 [Wyeomyia smithii]|uniref:uncharacterized protein LOC129731339 n=1 Tax=Wyeomyia smithii TaxID=174621 RepID=UPI002467D256|nr:uncharacterized protein LOC129731339 [Wyeomyia smithii]
MMSSETELSILNVVPNDNTCWLCHSASRPLSALFSSNDSSKLYRQQIFACLDIVAVYDRDANRAICTDCCDKLGSFSWFSHQGKSNDLFLRQLPQECFRAGEEYCRLCLSTNGHLQVVFPLGAEVDSDLCAIIKECIGVEVNYYRDLGAQICNLCRSQLLSFATYKQICKQLHSKSRDSLSDNEKQWKNNEILDGSASQNKRKQSNLIEVNAKRQKLDALGSKPLESSQKTDRKMIFRMLWTADDERNFEVIKEKKGRAKVYVAGFTFNFVNVKNDGSSLWYCEMKQLVKCKNAVTISADGKIAIFDPKLKHTHGSEIPRLLKCPPGKGCLLKEDGRVESFWLLHGVVNGRDHERHLFYHNNRYILRNFNLDNDTSIWSCRAKGCRMTVEVSGVFKKIYQIQGFHSHPDVSSREIEDALKANKVKSNSEDVITPFRENKAQDWQNKNTKIITKLAIPQIYTILAEEDSDRNFAVCGARGNRYKILYLGYYYKYYLRAPGGFTYWKCIWENIHNCMAMIAISNDGKRATKYGQIEHNHPTKYAPIFDYDLKQYSVRKVPCDTLDHMLLLSRDCIYFRSRSLLYRHNIYNLQLIINDVETRWSCVKVDLQRKQCPAQLIIHGQFETFLQKGEHCHSPFTGKEIKCVKQGNQLELSALNNDKKLSTENTEDTSSSGISENLLSMLKKQLFSYPVGRGIMWDSFEQRHHPFFLLTDNTKTRDNPNKVFYKHYRYSFASIDEYGTSQWICCQLLDTNTIQGTCTAHLIIEGVFQRVSFKGIHNHERIPEPIVEFLCSGAE